MKRVVLSLENNLAIQIILFVTDKLKKKTQDISAHANNFCLLNVTYNSKYMSYIRIRIRIALFVN